MHHTVSQRDRTAPAVFGLLLIVVGAVAVLEPALGVNLFGVHRRVGWPFFVIVPGVALLGASLLVARPNGVGFAVAGAIVTTVGSLLLYQSRTEQWESWAYAWALIPAAAGAALVLYGLYADVRGMVTVGSRMLLIAIGLFLVGVWFFEAVFAGANPWAGVGALWPLAVIAVGALIVLGAFRQPVRNDDPPPKEWPSDRDATPRT